MIIIIFIIDIVVDIVVFAVVAAVFCCVVEVDVHELLLLRPVLLCWCRHD